MADTLLNIENLRVAFQFESGWHDVLRGVDLQVKRGRILGLLGESGSGKTVTMTSAIGLLERDISRVHSGKAYFAGEDLLGLKEWQRAALRGSSIGFILQNPSSALNPYRRVGSQIREVYKLHGQSPNEDRIQQSLEAVGIVDPRSVLMMYPDQLSGGMAQRVLIAMTTLLEPELIIADEPTSAIDASLRKMVLDVFLRVNKQLESTLVIITHDFDVAAYACDDIAVMYGGLIMEAGPLDKILANPLHPYTEGLKACADSLTRKETVLYEMKGSPPDPRTRVEGCPYAPRCTGRTELCDQALPEARAVGDRVYRCHHPIGRDI